ncbi:MAG: TonB-dependent receptor [Candidatus Symbiothrix sp.]|jgi:TonB-linked SusC/RagA family outer membrane protein|nr:TonB-dependent receptor [Candidatus Symbiothrix sp.]
MYNSESKNIKKTLFQKLLGTKRFIVIALVALETVLCASNSFSQTKISLNLTNVSIESVFSEIEKKTDYVFLYKKSELLNKRVSVNEKNEEVDVILKKILNPIGFEHYINKKQIVVTEKKEKEENNNPKPSTQKQINVNGKILDNQGEPLIGVSVTVKGTGVGTATDLDGDFSLEKIPAGSELIFSYVGYNSQTVLANDEKPVKIVLKEIDTQIGEVVVIGYGVQKKATLIGSVSAIQTKDLLQSPQVNISNALAGRMPGLFSVQRSGEPGNDASMLRIRGVGTFAEGDTQEPLVMVDGVETTNYNNIDPNEIESVSILKDASATAVYGVRGANGVLLITTKRGVKGELKISLSSSVARSSFPFLRKNMNSYEYAGSYNLGQEYDSYVTGNNTRRFTQEDIEMYRTGADPIFYPDVDWYDVMLKDASWQTKSNLNISGGSGMIRYFFSLGYTTQNGMLNTDAYDPGYDAQLKYRRYNLRSNFDVDVTKDLALSFDLSTQIDDNRTPNWSIGYLMEMLSSISPLETPGVIDNKLVSLVEAKGGAKSSPLAAFNKGWKHKYGNTLNGSIRLNYKMDYLTPGLSLRGMVSYKNYNNLEQGYIQNGVVYDLRRTTNGNLLFTPDRDKEVPQFSESVSKDRRIYLEAGMEYARTFGEHAVGGLVLYNQSKYHSPDLAFLVPNGYQGIVGRVTYSFKNRYLAEFNIGYNGTENFIKGKRFGTFPAYSLGWILTEESFFPENEYVTFLKLRGSYGVVGNDKLDQAKYRFLYLPTTYVYSNGSLNDGSKGYYFGEWGSSSQWYKAANEGKLGNPDLTWEKAAKMNLGADIHFLKDKLNLTADWFKENRNNILTSRGTIPQIIGAEFPAYNLGKMENSGYEIELSYYGKAGKLNYFVKGNYTYAHNKIVYMDEADWKYPYQYHTGRRFGQYFGYVAEGLYNTWDEVNDPDRPIYMWNSNKVQPGDIRYKDVNEDGHIDTNDMMPIGYSNFPEKIFGLSLGGTYRKFDFSLLFQGAANVSILPSRRTMRGFYTNSGANKDLLKSWTQERYANGDEIVYPRFSVADSNPNYELSTYWLEDGKYLRLKNMEIGYTLNNPFLKKCGISSCRIYMNGNNLLTWCNLFPGEDPEFARGSNITEEPYPVTRIYNLGFNINF